MDLVLASLTSRSPGGLLFVHINDVFHQKIPLQSVDPMAVQNNLVPAGWASETTAWSSSAGKVWIWCLFTCWGVVSVNKYYAISYSSCCQKHILELEQEFSALSLYSQHIWSNCWDWIIINSSIIVHLIWIIYSLFFPFLTGSDVTDISDWNSIICFLCINKLQM